MINSEPFYIYLKKQRIKVGLNQTHLAQALKVASSTICYIEAGNYSRFPLDKVLSLAKVLRIDQDQFASLWVDAALDEQRIKMHAKIYKL